MKLRWTQISLSVWNEPLNEFNGFDEAKFKSREPMEKAMSIRGLWKCSKKDSSSKNTKIYQNSNPWINFQNLKANKPKISKNN